MRRSVDPEVNCSSDAIRAQLRKNLGDDDLSEQLKKLLFGVSRVHCPRLPAPRRCPLPPRCSPCSIEARWKSPGVSSPPWQARRRLMRWPCSRIERNKAVAISLQQLTAATRSRNSSECRARSQGQPRAFDRWRPQSGARRPTCPETRAPACKPGVPRAHGATCPTPPTQISTPSPRFSCAPSREPCSATR